MRFRSAAAAACLAAAQALAGAAAIDVPNTIQVRQAWIRWLPGSAPAGGYLTLINGGDRPVSLVAVVSSGYGTVAMHRSQLRDGISTMVAVERIIIAAHSTLNFASEGYHLMLTAPPIPVQPGDQVPVTLIFSDGTRLTVPFALRQPDGSVIRRDLTPSGDEKGHVER